MLTETLIAIVGSVMLLSVAAHQIISQILADEARFEEDYD